MPQQGFMQIEVIYLDAIRERLKCEEIFFSGVGEIKNSKNVWVTSNGRMLINRMGDDPLQTMYYSFIRKDIVY